MPEPTVDPYLSGLYQDLQKQDAQNQQLYSSLSYGVAQDPAAETQHQKLARVLGTTPDNVKVDPKRYAAVAKMRGFDTPAFSNQWPLTTGLMADPNNAAAAHDDLETYKHVEDQFKEAEAKGWLTGWTPAQREALAQSLLNQAEHNKNTNEAESIAANVNKALVSPFLTIAGTLAKAPEQMLNDLFGTKVNPNDPSIGGAVDSVTKWFEDWTNKSIKQGQPPQLWDPAGQRWFANPLYDPHGRELGNEIASLPGTLAAMVAGGEITAPVFAFNAGYAKFNQVYQQTGSAWKALTEGLGAGAANLVLMTKMPAPVTTKTVGGKLVSKGVGQTLVEQTARAVPLAGGMTIIDNTLRQLHEPDGNLTKDFSRQLVTFALFENVHTVNTAIARSQEAYSNYKFMVDLKQATENSAMFQRDPERFAEHLKQLGPDKDVSIDARTWTRYWQAQGEDPAAKAEAFGVDPTHYQEAEASANEMFVPVTRFVTETANTPHFEELAKDVRLKPNGVTIREAEAMAQQLADDVKANQEELQKLAQQDRADHPDYEKLREDFKVQAIGVGGDTAKVADEASRFFANVAINLAERASTKDRTVSPFDIAKRLVVERGTMTTAEATNGQPTRRNPVPNPAGRAGGGDVGAPGGQAEAGGRGPADVVADLPRPSDRPDGRDVVDLPVDPKLQAYQVRNLPVVEVGGRQIVAGPRPPYFSFHGNPKTDGQLNFSESPTNMGGFGVNLAQRYDVAGVKAHVQENGQVLATYVDVDRMVALDARNARTYTPEEARALGVPDAVQPMTGQELLLKLNKEYGAGAGLTRHLQDLGFNAVSFDYSSQEHPAWSILDRSLFKRVTDTKGWDRAEIQRREAFDPTPINLPNPVEGAKPITLYQRPAPGPIFYSALGRTVEGPELLKLAGRDGTANTEQVRTWLAARQKEGKFKQAELDAIGVNDYLDLQGKTVNLDDLRQFIKEGGVKVEETILGAAVMEPAPREIQVASDVLMRAGDIEMLPPDQAYSLSHPFSLDGDPATLRDVVRYLEAAQDTGAISTRTMDQAREAAITLNSYFDKLSDQFGRTNTKYQDYTLPGPSDNYRELLLTLPVKPLPPGVMGKPESFQSSHFDQQNILAHVRLTERPGPNGENILFVEEVQSDWAQKGRKQGFNDPKEVKKLEDAMYEAHDAMSYTHGATELAAARKVYEDATKAWRDAMAGPPSAPFVTDTKAWTSLAVKRILRYAVDHGMDQVAFVTGQQSADRYNLAQAVSAVRWGAHFNREGERTVALQADGGNINMQVDKNGVILNASRHPDELVGKTLEETVGKEVSDRILGDSPEGHGEIRQEELMTLGGQGMKAFYDKLLPSVVNDVVKKLGGEKMGITQVDSGSQLTPPKLHPMSDREWSTFGGAEEFPNGDKPLLATAEVIIDGERRKVDVVVDPNGIQLMGEGRDGEEIMLSYFVDADYTEPLKSATEAQNLLRDMWLKEPERRDSLWRQLSDHMSDVDRIIRPTNETTDQLVAKITPEMKAKILQGQALFQPDTGGEGPRGYFDLSNREEAFRIGMTENQNKSTVFHELTHFFVEMTNELARQTGAGEDIIKLNQDLRDWVGAKGDDPLTEVQHEKLADAMLLYLAEGKAPEPKLRDAFRRLATWFTKLGQQLISADVKLDPEVRGIFDRLIASDQAIEEAKKLMGDDQPLFATAEDMGVTQKEFELYQAAKRQDLEAAKERMTRELMRQLQREHAAEWRQQLAVTREQVAKELDAAPEYQALKALTTGELEDGTPIKLSKEALVERYGAEKLKELGRGRDLVYSATDGMDADSAALLLGYETGDQLIDALSGLEARGKRINREATARMKAEHGDLLTDPALFKDEALAMYNEQREDVLTRELKALNRLRRLAEDVNRVKTGEATKTDAQARRQAKADVPNIRAVRLAASAFVLNTPLFKTDPNRYRLAAEKASREAFTLQGKKDYAGAAEAKRTELLNHFMFLEAQRVLKVGDQLKAYAKRLQSPRTYGNLGKAGGTFQQQIDQLLERFDFKPKTNQALTDRETLAQWVEKMTADNEEAVVPEWIQNELLSKNYRELTNSQVQDLLDTMKNIKHLADRQLRVDTGTRKVEFGQLLDELETRARANNQSTPLPLPDSTNTLKQKAVNKLLGYDASLVKIQLLVNWLDGGDVNGPWHEAVWNPLAKAQALDLDKIVEINQKLQTHLEQMPDQQQNSMLDTFTVEGLNQPLNRKQIITMLFNMGTEANKAKLLGGYAKDGLTEEVLQRAFRNLNQHDVAFVQGVWDTIGELWPEVSALQKRLSGIEPKKEQPIPVTLTLADGSEVELKGGYFPLKAAAGRSTVAGKQETASTALFDYGGGYQKAATSTGHTKERTGAIYPLALDFVPIITQHTSQVIKDLTHREAVILANRILTNPRVRNLLGETLGESYRDQFQPWLRHIVNDRNGAAAEQATRWHAFAAKSRANLVAAMLGFKYSTVVVQLTDALRVVGPGEYRVPVDTFSKAFVDFLQSPKQTMQMVHELSGMMRHRAENLDRDIAASWQHLSGDNSWKAEWNRKAFMGLGYMDALISTPAWLGAYRDAIMRGQDSATAIKEADRTVELRLMSGAPKDLIGVQRDPDKFMKLVTMFMGDGPAQYNMLRHAGHKLDGLSGIGTFTATAAMVSMANIIGDYLKGQTPAPGEDKKRWALRKALLAWTQPIPVIRDVANAVDGKLAGKTYADYRLSPVVSVGQKLVDGIHHVVLAAEGKEAYPDAFIHGLDTLGTVYGVGGTSQFVASAKYLRRVQKGEEKPANTAELIYNTISGKPKEVKR